METSVAARGLCPNNARTCKLDSISSDTNKGLPTSLVAPMNYCKQGWRHLEAIFISYLNKSSLIVWRKNQLMDLPHRNG